MATFRCCWCGASFRTSEDRSFSGKGPKFAHVRWHAHGTNASESVKAAQCGTSLDPCNSRGGEGAPISTMTEYGSCPYSKATRGNIEVTINVVED